MEFAPHCAGKNQQGATHDTVKKQIVCDVKAQSEFGKDLAKLSENNMKHSNKDELWMGMGSHASGTE